MTSVALTMACATATATAAPSVVFDDEFASPQLDTANWATLTPWYTNYESGALGTYDSANTTVSDGTLHLVSTEATSDAGVIYTSGIVTSLPRAQFSYGYFEVRAKLPRGKGMWPAFWLTDDRSLEIDAFEVLGDRPRRAYMTLHENGEQVFQRFFDGPDFSAGYHTFGVDWQPTYVSWYVDGVRRATYAHDVPAGPVWICLDTAIGGTWPGSPDASTQFPQSFDVSYVRVWDAKPGSRAKGAGSSSGSAGQPTSAQPPRAAIATTAPSATATTAPSSPATQSSASVTSREPSQTPTPTPVGARPFASSAVMPPADISPSIELVRTVPAPASARPSLNLAVLASLASRSPHRGFGASSGR